MNQHKIIKQKYTPFNLNFKSYPKTVGVPLIDVILKDPGTGVVDLVSRKFIVDTGAYITIVNGQCTDFLSKLQPVDAVEIQYGAGTKVFHDVFIVELIIKGETIRTKVAFDPKCPFLLLGHHEFFEKMVYTLFDSSLSTLSICKRK